MSESDPIVRRIDALVRKRRSFIAAPASPESASAEEELRDDGDDIPLLTEVVDIAEVSGEAAGIAATPPLEPLLNALAADLAAAAEQRLEADLPSIVEQALGQFSLELRQGIAASLEAASRDFLARRQQLRLPLPDAPEQ